MDRARTWLPRALAALAFALYAAAVPAGPYWLGAADAAAGAIALGTPESVAHPAVLPLAAAASLLPVGELALRVHLLSAALAALAVLWTCRLTQEAGRDDLASLVGAGAAAAGVAVAVPFLRTATVAGEGALAAAVGALALVLFVRVARGEGARPGLALALTIGIGLASHAAFAALVPVALALIALRLWRGARWPLVAPLLAMGAAAALFAYLPVRAAAGDAGLWGQPATLAALWGHVFPGASAPAPAIWIASVAEPLGPGMIVAALGGAIWLALARRERWLLAALAALAVGDLLAGAGGALFALVAAVLAGLGLAWMARSLGRAGAYAGAAAAVIAVLPAALAGWGAARAAASGEIPRAFVEGALDSAPPRAGVLVRTPAAAAAIRYALLAEGARPDLALHPQRGAIPDRDDPAVWELGPTPPPPGFDLHVEAAPFARLVPVGEGRGDLEHAAENLAEAALAAAGDPAAARIYADALTQLSALALSRGRPVLARKLTAAARALE